MPKKQRTDKSRYKHQSTGDYCTCAAYVAEIMCMRKAEHENHGSLPFKFWNFKPWDWTFKRQLYAANKLIKEFSEIALVKGIASPELAGLYSLNNPKVRNVIRKHQLMLDEKPNTLQHLEVHAKPKTRKKSFGKKTTLNKLRELDGKEENGG